MLVSLRATSRLYSRYSTTLKYQLNGHHTSPFRDNGSGPCSLWMTQLRMWSSSSCRPLAQQWIYKAVYGTTTTRCAPSTAYIFYYPLLDLCQWRSFIAPPSFQFSFLQILPTKLIYFASPNVNLSKWHIHHKNPKCHIQISLHFLFVFGTIPSLPLSVFVKSYQRRRRRQVKVKDETDQWRILSDLSATWFIKENQQRRLCCLPKIAVRAQRLESQSINTKR